MSVEAGYYDSSYPPSLWDGSPPADTRMPVSPGQTVTNPVITAMPPAEWLGAINNAYRGVPVTAWTAGQSATIATLPVSWNAAAWVDFVAADPEPQADPEPPKSYGKPVEVNE
jgi:hypothetical protein